MLVLVVCGMRAEHSLVALLVTGMACESGAGLEPKWNPEVPDNRLVTAGEVLPCFTLNSTPTVDFGETWA